MATVSFDPIAFAKAARQKIVQSLPESTTLFNLAYKLVVGTQYYTYQIEREVLPPAKDTNFTGTQAYTFVDDNYLNINFNIKPITADRTLSALMLQSLDETNIEPELKLKVDSIIKSLATAIETKIASELSNKSTVVTSSQWMSNGVLDTDAINQSLNLALETMAQSEYFDSEQFAKSGALVIPNKMFVTLQRPYNQLTAPFVTVKDVIQKVVPNIYISKHVDAPYVLMEEDPFGLIVATMKDMPVVEVKKELTKSIIRAMHAVDVAVVPESPSDSTSKRIVKLQGA